jgi:Holliday junction DNA helicase RuvA
MIARLKGTLLNKQAPHVLIDVNGVGYELDVPMSTFYVLPAQGEALILHTHFIVREDAQLLFGFAKQEERQLFRELLRINGVGAKMALAVLSTLSTAELIGVIDQADMDQLVRVPGIGKKTAERMLLEMRGRISRFESLNVDAAASSVGHGAVLEAEDALQALGYSATEAKRLLKGLDPSLINSQDLIRGALQRAAK